MADGQPEVGILISYKEVDADKMEDAETKVKNLEGKVQDSSQAFRNLADGFMGLSQQFAAVGGGAIVQMASFEQKMANVQVLLGGTAADMADLREKADQMAAQFPQSADAILEGYAEMARSGRDLNDIMENSEEIIKFATATNASFASSAQLVSDVQDTWKVRNEELGTVTNTLAAATQNFEVTLPELQAALGQVGNQAKGLGLSLQTTVGVYGLLRNEQVEASQATMGMKMIFNQLTSAVSATEGPLLQVKNALQMNSNGSLNLQATLQNLQATVMAGMSPLEQQAFLNQIFGDRAAVVAGILVNQAGSIGEVTAQLGDMQAVETAYSAQASNTASKLQILQNRYDEEQRVLGERLLPAQIKILEAKTKFFDLINKLPGPLGEYAGGIMLAASELSSLLVPLSLMVQGMSALNLATIKTTATMVAHKVAAMATTVATWAWQAAQWALNIAMLANPVGLIILAIVALVVLIVAIIAYFTDWKTAIEYLGYAIMIWILGPLGILIILIREGVISMDDLKAAWYAIGDAFKWVWERVKDYFEMWFGFYEKLYEWGKNFVKKFIDGIIDGITEGKHLVEDAVKKISGFFGGSPPEWGPLKIAMEKGGPAFIQEYIGNMMKGMPSGTVSNDYSQRNLNFSPVVTNNGSGGDLMSMTEQQIVTFMKDAFRQMGREAMR
jgi:TP901 family phage tail tape measure protein